MMRYSFVMSIEGANALSLFILPADAGEERDEGLTV
jgi:hypothetical protein